MAGTSLYLTAELYLSHHYQAEIVKTLPLADESFVRFWAETEGNDALDFLAENVSDAALRFPLKNTEALRIFFAETLGGRLPVVVTGNHEDFCCMEAVLNGHEKVSDFPPAVNAFTMQARAARIYRHRVILLGSGPYSNIPAGVLGLEEEDWMERSYRLRLAHECTHYETLRLFGAMRNHALDEIAADAFGQIAALGSFSAARQRLFFGLEPGKDCCTGRLAFYCQSVDPKERPAVYRAVNAVLEDIEQETACLSAQKKRKRDILERLLRVSIMERLQRLGS